tara:strand:- start:452 stop:706 length:255 start_codon:yes stop_codon:yes gene_type:complete
MNNLIKSIVFIVVAFIIFFIGCKSFIPEYYYQRGQSFEEYENYRKANVYYMIFSDSYYPGTEKAMERGDGKQTEEYFDHLRNAF